MLDSYFGRNLISEWDTIFYNDIAPLVFEKIVSGSRYLADLRADFTAEAKYRAANG